MKFVPDNAEVAVMAVPTRPLRVWLEGLMDGVATTVILTVAVAVPLVAPVPVMVYVVAESKPVGVPVIAPVVLFSVNPEGELGLTAYVTLPVKLFAVRLEVAVIATPTFALTVCVDGLILGAAPMVMLTVAVATPLTAPEPVTV